VGRPQKAAPLFLLATVVADDGAGDGQALSAWADGTNKGTGVATPVPLLIFSIQGQAALRRRQSCLSSQALTSPNTSNNHHPHEMVSVRLRVLP